MWGEGQGEGERGREYRYGDKVVRVINLGERFPTLSDKLAFMIDHARGDSFCRWDDDDLSLPWRLSLSLDRLGNALEWHAENYWWNPVHDANPRLRRRSRRGIKRICRTGPSFTSPLPRGSGTWVSKGTKRADTQKEEEREEFQAKVFTS